MKYFLLILSTMLVGELFAQTYDACQKCKECLPLAEEVRMNTAEYEQIKAESREAASNQESMVPFDARMRNNRAEAKQLQDKLTKSGCWGYVKFKNCDHICKDYQSDNINIEIDSQGREVWPAGDNFALTHTGRISVKNGKVYYDPLTNKIEIPIGSRAEMRYDDGTFLNLKEGSVVQFMGEESIIIEKGDVRLNVRKRGQNFEIRTPPAIVGVEGTQLEVKVNPDYSADIFLFEGQITVSNNTGKVVLNTGEMIASSDMDATLVVKKFDVNNPSNIWIPNATGQMKWKPLLKNQSLFIKNFSSYGSDYFIAAAGSRSTSMNATHILKIDDKASLRESINSHNEALDVHQADRKNYWVCGYKGLIAHSEIYGNDGSWEVQNSGTDKTLNAIWFTDINNGWAVGDGGVIVHTSDGGKTWRKQNSHCSSRINDVQFIDKNKGWALVERAENFNARLLLTRNGGQTWSTIKFKSHYSSMNMNRMFFINKNTGWICTDFLSTYKTTDGGYTWNRQESLTKTSGSKIDLNDIYFLNSYEGWTCGDRGHLYHTTNGGSSWQKVDIGEQIHLTAIGFNGPHYGMLAAGNKVYVRFDLEKFEKYRNAFLVAEKNKKPRANQSQAKINQNSEHSNVFSDKPTSQIHYSSVENGSQWEVRQYDINILESACNKLAEENKMPAGIDLNNGKMNLFCVNSMPFKVYGLKLEKYTVISDISAQVTKLMNQNFIPVGMTLADKEYYFLYAKTNLKATAWQIVESELNHQDVSNDIQPFLEQKYVPLAISTLADQWFYTLLVQFESFPASNWLLRGYGSTKSLEGIDGEIDKGFMPVGYLTAGTISNVLYLTMY